MVYRKIGVQVGDTGSRTEDRNRRWATASTATSAAALVTLFFVSDEELCTDYWSDLHDGRACNCQLGY